MKIGVSHFLACLLAVGRLSLSSAQPFNESSTDPFFDGLTSDPETIVIDDTMTPSTDSESKAPLGSFITKRYEGMKLFNPAVSIPADPHGAAGPCTLISVVNRDIRAQDKYTGANLWTVSLLDFFPRSRNAPFDPKVIYDTHENRFLVVALEGDGFQTYGRIHLAVSKDNNPQTSNDWYKYTLNGRATIDGIVSFVDYPGFAVDEEAIYITNNMFSADRAFVASRLWIIGKRALYYSNGGNRIIRTANLRTPGNSRWGTYQPAEIRVTDAAGAGCGVGTYLVSFDFRGLVYPNGDEALHVLVVIDPLGDKPRLKNFFVNLGDIMPFGGLPNAPQRGNADHPIETNDNRVLEAVWNRDFLWCVFTVSRGGKAQAHYVKMATSIMPGGEPVVSGSPVDQGAIQGTDIAGSNTYTYFPSIAINRKGIVAYGFSASSNMTYAGAYVVYRDDVRWANGVVSGTGVVREGLAPYKRYFGGPRNRWGDYTSVVVDPADEDCFWVFNKYADSLGCTVTEGSQGREDGCWGTGWAQMCIRPGIRPDSNDAVGNE